MYTILALLIAASQTVYEAKATSFGCTSAEEVLNLQRIRADDKAYQIELYQQIFNGQCVEIQKGQVIEGAVDATDSSMLQVDREIEPPGFLAPADDFKVKTANEEK